MSEPDQNDQSNFSPVEMTLDRDGITGLLNRLKTLPFDGLIALVFFTRLPITLPNILFQRHDRGAASLAQGAPLVGLLVGALVGCMAVLCVTLGLPVMASATIAVAIGALITGGLHEDGLADVADGFGGGRDKARKLTIMKDSTIGTYGVLALLFSQLLRIALLAALLNVDWSLAMVASALAHTLSRTASTVLWGTLPNARGNGLSASIGQPDQMALIVSIIISLISVLLLGILTGVLIAATLGIILVTAATLGFRWLCQRQIGGQTGDTIGATQQICEVAFLIAVLMSAP